MSIPLPPRPARVLRHVPFVLILAAAALGAFAFRDLLTFEALARHREALIAFRDAHYLWASLGFVVVYTAIVALSVPGATIATLAGGFLFGMFPGVLYNVVAATAGAAVVFLAARAGLGADVSARIAARRGAVETGRAKCTTRAPRLLDPLRRWPASSRATSGPGKPSSPFWPSWPSRAGAVRARSWRRPRSWRPSCTPIWKS